MHYFNPYCSIVCSFNLSNPVDVIDVRLRMQLVTVRVKAKIDLSIFQKNKFVSVCPFIRHHVCLYLNVSSIFISAVSKNLCEFANFTVSDNKEEHNAFIFFCF